MKPSLRRRQCEQRLEEGKNVCDARQRSWQTEEEKPWGPTVSGMNETEWGMSVGKPLDDFEEVGHDLT